MTATSKFRFKNLDSIRTLAFLSTFLAHAFYTKSDAVLNSSAFQFVTRLRDTFSFGVPVFFVLSGFLISYLMLKEQESNGRFGLKQFYMRRILRIWPVFFIVIIFGFIIFPIFRTIILHDPYVESANWPYYISFLSNFDQMNQSTLPYGVGLGPTWSVSIEEQFYVFWPLLILLFKKKSFIIPIALTIIGSILLTSIFELTNKHTIFCMTYLATGGAFAYLAFYHQSLVERITKISGFIFLVAVAALFGLIYLTTLRYSHIIVIFAIAAVIGYIIIYQCYSERIELRKIPVLERMGKYTYGLYLYHVICNFIVHIVLDKILGFNESVIMSVFIKPLLSLLLSVILSYLSYRYVESYFLKLKSKFSILQH